MCVATTRAHSKLPDFRSRRWTPRSRCSTTIFPMPGSTGATRSSEVARGLGWSLVRLQPQPRGVHRRWCRHRRRPSRLRSGIRPAGCATAPPCPTTAYANPGVVTIIDFSGDSIMAQAEIGTGPLTFSLNASGTTAYSLNCDNTMSTVPITTTLQTKNVLQVSIVSF